LSKTDWNGEPRGYRIYHRRKEALTPDWHVVTLDDGINMNSAILAGLEEWVEYQVKILAFNDVGDSPFSAVVVERTRESGNHS